MSCAKKLLSRLGLVLGYVLCIGLCACTSTVAPGTAKSSQASFDQGQQNSGVIAELPDRSLVVTTHLRDRYNALVIIYGAAFQPALVADQGLQSTATNTFVMSSEAFEHFASMNRWRKQGAPPWFKP